MNQVIFHVDVNSAYLSWSAIKSLAGGGGEDYRQIPCVVGGDESKRHGVVLAKSFRRRSMESARVSPCSRPGENART